MFATSVLRSGHRVFPGFTCRHGDHQYRAFAASPGSASLWIQGSGNALPPVVFLLALTFDQSVVIGTASLEIPSPRLLRPLVCDASATVVVACRLSSPHGGGNIGALVVAALILQLDLKNMNIGRDVCTLWTELFPWRPEDLASLTGPSACNALL